MGLFGRKKPSKQSAPQSAADVFSAGVPSIVQKNGRLLTLHFSSATSPELIKLEFQADKASKKRFLQNGLLDDPAHTFRTDRVSKAVGIFFLDYLCARLKSPPKGYQMEGEQGSPAASLGYAIYDRGTCWHRLFVGQNEQGHDISLTKSIFRGSNFHGKGKKPRLIFPDIEQLPVECVRIVWNQEPLAGLVQIQKLTEAFRRAWELPPPTELDLPEGEGKPAAPEEKLSQPGFKQRPPPSALELFPDETKAPVVPEPKPQAGTPPSKESPEADINTGDWEIRFKSEPIPKQPKPEPQPVEFPAPEPHPPIDPRLFQIQNPQGHTWDDNEELIDFVGDGSGTDVWRIRDACEGTLIFGAVGSGKTSGSGSAIARAFLQAGFGGLVLTAKPDEARRWLRMCRETGRMEDCVHLTPGSGHKLNFLQYETQRPGERLAVTDDLIALFRCLLEVISQNGQKGGRNEEFWNNATDQLMRKLFDIFLLAGEPLSLDRLVRFMNRVPKDSKTNWREDVAFGRIIALAETNAKKGSDEDKRIFQEAFEYWTRDYPLITEGTQSGIITSVSAMADNLSGRGIHEMLGTTTNLTPEMILSGKIVILDIPLKGNVKSGLMVQAIWKLLFQQAAERRADKGLPTARPAFLWEDEGHLFFSHNDTNFQPTARDIRAPHVIISQNLHNFLQRGHNEHAFYAVFAAMNTYIFHTNGDLETNRWASAHIGEIRKLKLTTDGLLRPMRDKDITFSQRRPEEVENVGKMSITEDKKAAMPPEDFAKLKRGGDGTCEAVLVWLSHQFAANNYRNFCVLTFEQEPR